jgi:hypothetical protein
MMSCEFEFSVKEVAEYSNPKPALFNSSLELIYELYSSAYPSNRALYGWPQQMEADQALQSRG